jgi:hypothetical protein
MKAKIEQQQEARRLRTLGWSLKEIAEKLTVSKGSVSAWVRDVVLSDGQKTALYDRRSMAGKFAGARANRQKHKENRAVYQETGRVKAREGNPLHLMGCMLYWAEGAKSKNHLYFVNSDPHMMTLFMRFLREELDVANSDIVLYIHCHTQDDAEVTRIEQYWLELLQLSPECHRKTLYKKGSNSRRNVLENGIGCIRVYKTELVMHIFGAIQEYGGFDNPNWLF